MDALPVVDSDVIHMGKNTFMWVQLTHFGLQTGDDRSAIAALIASPGYAHDYASPFTSRSSQIPSPDPVYRPVHGRWWLSAIHPDRFEPTTADEAEDLIRKWAEDQSWSDPGYRQPAEVLQRLSPMYELLRSGNLYQLSNPSDEDIHNYGESTGGLGFHEFVVIDSTRGRVHVIVASDD